MADYRRVFVEGGCYFFTVVTHQRRRLFIHEDVINRLREAFRRVRGAHPFQIDAIVILPDHLHTIWRLPEGDTGYPLRWRKIKHYLSVSLEAGTLRQSMARKREKAIWQRRYWEHVIRDESDWQRHVDFVHFNPVKHGLVKSPADWPYSSFRRARLMGWYPPDWGIQIPDTLGNLEGEWGE